MRRGVACTDNALSESLSGAVITFCFDSKPKIVSSEAMINKLDLEFAAQYLASWSSPVFGKTKVDVMAEHSTNNIAIHLFDEAQDESFVASVRLGSLFDDLANLFRLAILKEARG
jgi:hypothetical protein